MARAAGPERRTMPMPPRPGGVEMATMVSSAVMFFIFCQGTAFAGAVFFAVWGKGVFTGGFCVLMRFFAGKFVVIAWWKMVVGWSVLWWVEVRQFWRIYFLVAREALGGCGAQARCI
jgi:hypothetical protein